MSVYGRTLGAKQITPPCTPVPSRERGPGPDDLGAPRFYEDTSRWEQGVLCTLVMLTSKGKLSREKKWQLVAYLACLPFITNHHEAPEVP